MLAIYKREMRAYFTTPIGYVFAAIFLAFSAAVFTYTTLYALSSDTTDYFTIMLFSFIILLPLLTMKTLSEERKMKTEQLLLTSPVSLTGMVCAKFLAAFTVFFGCMLLTSLNFIILYTHSEPNTAIILGNLAALILVGMAFLSIGLFVSSLTESQLAASVITVAILLVLLVIGFAGNLIGAPWLRFLLSGLSVFSRFQNFTNGVFDIAALVYYVSLTAVFLFLTVRVYDRRRFA
ncbi:MAG: ABC transporter permease [Clostridia bacterium]|nr:ABC transporter permease [Clostridia bacterium]